MHGRRVVCDRRLGLRFLVHIALAHARMMQVRNVGLRLPEKVLGQAPLPVSESELPWVARHSLLILLSAGNQLCGGPSG